MVSFWLAVQGESNEDPIPETAQKLLQVMNMSETELEERSENPQERQKALSLGDQLGIVTRFLWLLDQKSASLEGSPNGHTLEDDIAILEKGPDAVPTSLWSCVLYRASQKRCLRGYRKAASAKLDKIIAAMNEQHSV